MSRHVSIERMHESLDGMLSSAEAGVLEAHVDECAACRNEYARLSEVVASLRALPRSAAVPEDAWDGIAERIGEAPNERASTEASVLSLPPAVAGRRVAPRGRLSSKRLILSVTQLSAAAAVVALVSAGAVWLVLGGGGSGADVATETTGSAPGPAATPVSLESGGYVEVLAELERIVADGRGVLAAETLVTIEASLRTVDAAIADVERALADDPSSDLLLRMLATHRRTKLGVLQRAAAAVQAQT